MDFVWIYAKEYSAWHLGGQFNELDYSIRSVRKNYQDWVGCFVIGDDPKLEATHLKAPKLLKQGDDPMGQHVNLDLLNKLQGIIDSPVVNEEFILMYDDIFLLKPTTEEQIKTTYGRCEVTNPAEYIRTRCGGTPYKRLWLSTYDYIITYRHSKGLKTYDWETHLPRFMEKSKLKTLIKDLNLRDIPKIPTSMYSAYYGGDTKIIEEGFQSDIYTHVPKMDFDKEFECQFMNIGDSVIVPSLINKMKELFG